MEKLKHLNFKALIGETITGVEFGNKLLHGLGSYGAETLKTASGRTFVFWQSMGEVNISEVIESIKP